MTVHSTKCRAPRARWSSNSTITLGAVALATSLLCATTTRAQFPSKVVQEATFAQGRYVHGAVNGVAHDHLHPVVYGELLDLDGSPDTIEIALSLAHSANPHPNERTTSPIPLSRTLTAGTAELPLNATSLVPPSFVSALHVQDGGDPHYDHFVVTALVKVLDSSPAQISDFLFDVSGHHWSHAAEGGYASSSVITLNGRRPQFGATYLFDPETNAMTLMVDAINLNAFDVGTVTLTRCSDDAPILELPASAFTDSSPALTTLFAFATYRDVAVPPAQLPLLRAGAACLNVGTFAGHMMASLPAPVAIPVTPAPPMAVPLYGAEALQSPIKRAMDECTADGLLPANSLNYLSTSSSLAGKAMTGGDSAALPPIEEKHQQIAPQARFMSSGECNYIAPSRGQGLSIGLDPIAVLADHSEPHNQCDTLRYTGSLSGYTFSDWRDVLRVLYTGQTSKVTSDPCSATAPARTPSAPGNITGRCGGPVRHALVENWNNMFEGGCTNGACPNGLRHAFRPADASDTTEAFLTLLGLPASTTRTFCNGFDVEDLDPIRRACDPNEQVCGNIPYANRGANPNGGTPSGPATNPSVAGGDLGLVLAVPMTDASSIQYGPPCALGAFAYAAMPFAAALESQRCPDGNYRAVNRCRWPQTADRKYGCRAGATTRPPIRTFINMDGRAYNWVPRHPDTGAILNATPGVTDSRWGGAGLYRLHQTTTMAGGASTCTQTDATNQIGCLVNADPCSIGYASRRALAWDGTTDGSKALALRSPLAPGVSVAPTDANVVLHLDPSGTPNGSCGNGSGDDFGLRYPLARPLFINASVGFGGDLETFPGVSDVTASGKRSNENQFLRCIADRGNGILDQAMSASGYVTMPGTEYPVTTCP